VRILLAAEGTRGDVHPLLALGEACREDGHLVRVCAPDHFRPAAEARGFEFRASGVDVLDTLREHARACIEGGLRLLWAQRGYAEMLVSDAFDTVCEAAEGADLVLGAGVQLGAPTAAELQGVPYRYVAYCPALLPSREHGPAVLPFQDLPPWANALLWRAVPLLFRPILAHVNRRRRERGLPPARGPFDYTLGPLPVVLAADAGLAPPPVGGTFAVDAIGALQGDDDGPLPEKLEAFLDAGPAPVYVGFGSMPDPHPETTTDVVLEAVERAGCRALLGRGWAGLGESGLPEHVMPLSCVSHARLFPRVAAVVHHGGAGTTTTAARAGAPQIVVPHLLDQFYWARRVHALGLGPPGVRRSRLTAEVLGETLAATAANELVRERARALGRSLRAADPLSPERRAHTRARVLGPDAA